MYVKVALVALPFMAAGLLYAVARGGYEFGMDAGSWISDWLERG